MAKKKGSGFSKYTDEELYKIFGIGKLTRKTEERNESTSVEKKKKNTKLPEIEIGVSRDIDRNSAEKLRRGKIKIEATLDLHGYKLKEAELLLKDFIDSSFYSSKRCIRIITGKGLKSRSSFTIHSSIEGWLNRPGTREKIITVSFAPLTDGGKGAVYVLLRKPN